MRSIRKIGGLVLVVAAIGFLGLWYSGYVLDFERHAATRQVVVYADFADPPTENSRRVGELGPGDTCTVERLGGGKMIKMWKVRCGRIVGWVEDPSAFVPPL